LMFVEKKSNKNKKLQCIQSEKKKY